MGRTGWLSFWLALGLSTVGGVAGGQSGVPTPAEVAPATKPKPTKEQAPNDRNRLTEPSANVIVPLAMYTPETHVGFGGLFVHFFRPSLQRKNGRVSSIAFLAIGTTRRQAILEAHPDFYFFAEDLHLFGKLEYQYFPDTFWGIGPRVPDEDETDYSRERFRFRGGAHYRILGPLYGGLALDAMDYNPIYGPSGVFAEQDIPGERGGFTFGAGPSAVYDTRDNPVASHSGTLLSTGLLWFPPSLGRYSFQKFVFEARQFFDLGKRHALATRFYGEVQGGNVPYYHLAMLGGDEMLRGYYYGRYRDETLLAVEAEYRFPVVWKFGGVLFAGAGEVAPIVADLARVPIRWAVGGGGRFSLSDEERLNLRLDAGFGLHTWGIYFTAREAF